MKKLLKWHPKHADISRGCQLELSTEASSFPALATAQGQIWKKCSEVLSLLYDSECDRPVCIAVSAWIDNGNVYTRIKTTREGGSHSTLALLSIQSNWLAGIYSSLSDPSDESGFDEEYNRVIRSIFKMIKGSLEAEEGRAFVSNLKRLQYEIVFSDSDDEETAEMLNLPN